MKAIIDTNVAAYLLLGTEPYAEEADRFFRLVTVRLAPTFWEAELTNVVWRAIRAGVLHAEEGVAKLRQADRLGIVSVETRPLCQGALRRSLASGIAVYDTLFVELAVRERCPLATFDKALLKAFPEIARRPAAISGSAKP